MSDDEPAPPPRGIRRIRDPRIRRIKPPEAPPEPPPSLPDLFPDEHIHDILNAWSYNYHETGRGQEDFGEILDELDPQQPPILTNDIIHKIKEGLWSNISDPEYVAILRDVVLNARKLNPKKLSETSRRQLEQLQSELNAKGLLTGKIKYDTGTAPRVFVGVSDYIPPSQEQKPQRHTSPSKPYHARPGLSSTTQEALALENAKRTQTAEAVAEKLQPSFQDMTVGDVFSNPEFDRDELIVEIDDYLIQQRENNGLEILPQEAAGEILEMIINYNNMSNNSLNQDDFRKILNRFANTWISQKESEEKQATTTKPLVIPTKKKERIK